MKSPFYCRPRVVSVTFSIRCYLFVRVNNKLKSSRVSPRPFFFFQTEMTLCCTSVLTVEIHADNLVLSIGTILTCYTNVTVINFITRVLN